MRRGRRSTPLPQMERTDTSIINACLNGSRGRGDNPNVPSKPGKVAEEAVRCYEAAASIDHIHARTSDGRTSYDPQQQRRQMS